MALHTYFRSKDELLDAVRDHVLRGLADAQADGDSADRLRTIATSLYRLLIEHPTLVHLFATRPLAGTEAAETTEAQLAALRDAGFDRVTVARAYLTLLHHALGAATWEVQLNAGRGDVEGSKVERLTDRLLVCMAPCNTSPGKDLGAREDAPPPSHQRPRIRRQVVLVSGVIAQETSAVVMLLARSGQTV